LGPPFFWATAIVSRPDIAIIETTADKAFHSFIGFLLLSYGTASVRTLNVPKDGCVEKSAVKQTHFTAPVVASVILSTACEASLISLLALIEPTRILSGVDARTIRVLAVCAAGRLSGGRCISAERECRSRDERQSRAEQGKFLFHFVVLQKFTAALRRLRPALLGTFKGKQTLELRLRQRTIPYVFQ
jgi:hypothetical protein